MERFTGLLGLIAIVAVAYAVLDEPACDSTPRHLAGAWGSSSGSRSSF